MCCRHLGESVCINLASSARLFYQKRQGLVLARPARKGSFTDVASSRLGATALSLVYVWLADWLAASCWLCCCLYETTCQLPFLQNRTSLCIIIVSLENYVSLNLFFYSNFKIYISALTFYFFHLPLSSTFSSFCNIVTSKLLLLS